MMGAVKKFYHDEICGNADRAEHGSPFQLRAAVCEYCEGGGQVESFARYAGEYMAGEIIAIRCDQCNGSGESGWDEACSECDREAPLNDEGLCERCVEELAA